MSARVARRLALLVPVLLVGTACDDGGAGRRYRAERDYWRADRAAERLAVNPDLVGDNERLYVADLFLKVGAKYVNVVDSTNVEDARGSDLWVARIGARAMLAAAGFYLRAGDAEMAKQIARELREVMSWSPPAAMRAQAVLVEALRATGPEEETIREMWRLAERYPAASEDGSEEYPAFNAPLGVVRYLRQTGDDAESATRRAIAYYENVRERWPRSYVAYLADLNRSGLYDEAGDWQRAARVLQEAIDAYPPDVLPPDQAARVAFTLGSLLMADRRDVEQAVVALEDAIALAPQSDAAWDARLTLAEYHAESGRFEQASALFLEVAEGVPNDRLRAPSARFSAAQALEAAGRWEDAVGEFRRLEVAYPRTGPAKRVPFVVSAHFRRVGEEERADSILEEAEREYRRTIEEDVDSEAAFEAYRFLFNALVARSEWGMAVREIETFANTYTGRPEAALMLLQAAEIARDHLGDPERSAAFLERVETEYPNSRFAEQAAELRAAAN